MATKRKISSVRERNYEDYEARNPLEARKAEHSAELSRMRGNIRKSLGKNSGIKKTTRNSVNTNKSRKGNSNKGK